LDRLIYKRDGVIQPRKGRAITKIENQDGYYSLKLCKAGIDKSVRVHRLVAEAFIPNPNDLPEINHIDCNRKNNFVENLEWCSHYDNIQYTILNNNHVSQRNLSGANNPNYRNHKLSEFYKCNKSVAIEKLARPKEQNGRAVTIELYDIDFNFIEKFNWIGACAEYLINNNFTTAKINSIRTNINKSIKFNEAYLNHYYKIA
jgi:hypothetical protein